MTDGGTEVRKLSFQVEGTELVKFTQQAAVGLNKVNIEMGMTAKEAAKAQRALATAQDKMMKAAISAARLKDQQRTLNKELTASNKSARTYSDQLNTSNRRLNEQKEVVKAQRAAIQALAKDNLVLATSFKKVGGAAQQSSQKIKIGTLGAPLVQTPQGYFPNGAVPLKQITQEARTAKDAVDDLGQNVQMNALRYQLYDVMNTLNVIGREGLEAGLGIFKTGIEWDKNFANVIRTSQVTGHAVDVLKEKFLDLQTTIPVTAQDLAEIGTLGAQMGVAASELDNFVGVTAKFAAAAGTNVEESATALARLNELLPDVQGNYERLGSTILRTGVNAVATESQIVRGTNQIAAMGQIAGLTTPEIVGLSSAMSSLGFSPELQRSVITSSFSRILTATSQVTKKTEEFGAVLNMTGKQFQEAWRKDAIGTFSNLLEAISRRGDSVAILQNLGLASQRLTPNLLKLGQNTNVLKDALTDTRDEWEKNTEMTRQYDIIAGTVSAKIQVLGQTWDALLVTLDEGSPVIGALVDGLTQVVRWLREVGKTPGVGTIASIGGVMIAAASATALAAAALAGLSAGYIAITNAVAGLTALTSTNTAITGQNTLAVGTNAAIRGESVIAIGAQTGAIAGNTAAMEANGFAMSKTGTALLGFSAKTVGALPSILKWTGIIGGVTAAIVGLVSVVATAPDWTHDWDKAFNGVDTTSKTIKFDTEKIKGALKDIATLSKEVAKYDEATKRGAPLPDDIDIDTTAAFRLSGAHHDLVRVTKDLKDAFDELETPEEKYAAVNAVARELGVTQEDLLTNILPELGKELGDNAAAMAEAQEQTELLKAAQEAWAATLLTTEANLERLKGGVTSGAKSFLDFSGALKAAYEVDDKTGVRIGDGLSGFLGDMNKQIVGFEKFYGRLGDLVQKGGVQLASFFAAQGPEAAEALADSLKLSDKQIAQIEDQMSLAQFYQSEDFANTFAQNNAILAQVWRQTNSHEAVAAFNKALSDSMKGAGIDPRALGELADKFDVKLNAQLFPTIDPDLFNQYISLASADITPVEIPVITQTGGVPEMLDRWIVTMEGHSIVLPVDPETDEGARLIKKWRDNEYLIPLELRATADTVEATTRMKAFRDFWNGKSIDFKIRTSYAYNSGTVGGIPGGATGALVDKNQLVRQNYPGFANGTILRGPGTGTSDSMLARVSNGEAITNARAVRFWGTQFMEDINRMRLPRFAAGNMIGPGTSGQGGNVNVRVVQYYPTTRDPIKKLKEKTENLVAGIWGGTND